MSDRAGINRCDADAAHLARDYAKEGELPVIVHTNNNDLRYLSLVFPRSADRTSIGVALQRAGTLLLDGEPAQ